MGGAQRSESSIQSPVIAKACADASTMPNNSHLEAWPSAARKRSSSSNSYASTHRWEIHDGDKSRSVLVYCVFDLP